MIYKKNNKPWMIAHLLTTWFAKYLKPAVENNCSEKKKIKILLFIDSTPGHLRTVMETYRKIYVVFMPDDTTSILQSIVQGAILAFSLIN